MLAVADGEKKMERMLEKGPLKTVWEDEDYDSDPDPGSDTDSE